MYFIEKIIDLLVTQDYSIVLGILSALIGYVIYYQHKLSGELQEKWEEILNVVKENGLHHNQTQEQMKQMREMIREDLVPILRHLENDLQSVNNLYREIEEVRGDQREGFNNLRDDINQSRSEFRDVLKFALNGRKKDCNN